MQRLHKGQRTVLIINDTEQLCATQQKNEDGTLLVTKVKSSISQGIIHQVQRQPLRNGGDKSDLKNVQLSEILIDFIGQIQKWNKTFPGSPVVRTCAFTVMDLGSNPDWGTKIVQADMWHSQKKKGINLLISLMSVSELSLPFATTKI